MAGAAHPRMRPGQIAHESPIASFADRRSTLTRPPDHPISDRPYWLVRPTFRCSSKKSNIADRFGATTLV
jgi:hypothetical protein